MEKTQRHITVFEHQSIRLNQVIDGAVFDGPRLKALQAYYGLKGVPYFSLINNGIRFNQFVGVIQVGDFIFEVLPKADRVFNETDEKAQWRNMLIDMLHAVGEFDVRATSASALKIRPNSILELYIQLFIREVEYLLHTGLIRQYRQVEGNLNSLKGRLLFGRQIQYNLTRQERFYTRHSSYDAGHQLHCILFKTIRLLRRINTNAGLYGSIGNLLLHFPEMPEISVTETTFEKLVFNRKNRAYQKAIQIARLLLLQYHPDLSGGRNHVLALMFDMNRLWEKFVYASLQKHKAAGTIITAQKTKPFWKTENHHPSRLKPDVLIRTEKQGSMVLDTKWKNLKGYKPSPGDLRQLYVYLEYFGAWKAALVYPGIESPPIRGVYLDPATGLQTDKECLIIFLPVERAIDKWQKNICVAVMNCLNLPRPE